MLYPRVAQRELKAEVQKERRQQKVCARLKPENGPVECIELAGEVEDIQYEGSETNKIKVQGMGGTGPFQQNKNADQEIKQTDNFKVSLLPQNSFRLWPDN